jgi:Fic family protein
MLFQTPVLSAEERWVLEQVEDLRARLSSRVIESRRWVGSLRRVSFARAIQGSNSIEGYNVTLDDAVAAADNEEPLDATAETWAAVSGYRDAMTYVLQLADDLHFELNEALLRSLHYMMLRYDLGKSPGKWRPGTIVVRNDLTDQIVYEGPEAGEVPRLARELVAGLDADDALPALIRASMAHLNLVMIHPFRDGNGRMARCLQTLVLAREGILSPQFCSIEEYLGRNTQAYYDVLAEVGAGHRQPERDARPWIRFSLTAHYRQARTLLRRAEEAEQRWGLLEAAIAKRKLPDRSLGPLFNASMGLRLRNATYRAEADVSELVASRDLKALVDADLLVPNGAKRGRYYTRTTLLTDIDIEVRSRRPPQATEDPFEAARAALRTSIWPQPGPGS